jgi:hypothetical protein
VATQRLFIATVAGDAAIEIARRFSFWRRTEETNDPLAVDRLCLALRENSSSLPIIYFAEWVDHWLMGNLVPGPSAVIGQRFQATCLTASEAVEFANRCGKQFDEQGWLSRRLGEAAVAYQPATDRVIVIAREVLGASSTNDEVEASLTRIPEWLAISNECEQAS